MKLSYIIQPTDNFINVKEVLKTRLQVSDRLLLKLKKEQKILLNNVQCFVWSQVKNNDIIEILINSDEDNSNILATKMNLNILYEDEAYLVINKPSGLPIHPSMDHYTDSLSNGLKYYFDTISLHKKIRPVNRLDKNTSGIVIFAKNEYIQECLIKQMQTNTFSKEYIAICNGIFSEKSGTINLPISRRENSIIERCIDENAGALSITHYEVLEEYYHEEYPYSVVKCQLETGRTHQIRVHMQAIGHSLIGDTLYGTSSPLINRQALHAYQVKFIHPITKQKVNYIAPLPQDMRKLCNI